MRIKMTRQLKLFLVFVLILLSAVFARYGTRVFRSETTSPEVQRISRDFRNAENQSKHQIRFNVDDFDDFLTFLSGLETETRPPISILAMQRLPNSLVYLVEIRTTIFNTFLGSIRDYDPEATKTENSSYTPTVTVSLRNRLADSERVRRGLLEQLNDPRHSQSRLQDQIAAINETIESITIQIR